MKNLILTLSFIFLLLPLVAQETESIFISYSPNNIILRIDGSEVIPLKDKPNAFILSLSVGKHVIEAWAEGFEMQKYDVEISSAKINNLLIGLNTLKSDFETHLEEQRKYRNNKLKNLIINTVAVSATSVLVYETTTYYDVNNKNKLLLESNLALTRDQYTRAINDEELNNAKNAHTDAVNALKNREKMGKTIQAATIGVGALTIFRLIKEVTKKKMKRPVYKDPNPFVFINDEKNNSLDITLIPTGIAFHF